MEKSQDLNLNFEQHFICGKKLLQNLHADLFYFMYKCHLCSKYVKPPIVCFHLITIRSTNLKYFFFLHIFIFSGLDPKSEDI